MDEVSGSLDNPLLVVPLAKGVPAAQNRDGGAAPPAAAPASNLFPMPPSSSSGATLMIMAVTLEGKNRGPALVC